MYNAKKHFISNVFYFSKMISLCHSLSFCQATKAINKYILKKFSNNVWY